LTALQIASPDGGYRVAFLNHTDREVKVTVNGDSISLPAKHSTTTTVYGRFRWAVDGQENTAGIVGGSAEVAIR
jgi:hypothetical protein